MFVVCDGYTTGEEHIVAPRQRSAVQGLHEHRLCVPAPVASTWVGGIEMVLLDALAPSGRLASRSDSFEISLEGKPMAYEVVELVAEAVSKDRVVHGLAAPV